MKKYSFRLLLFLGFVLNSTLFFTSCTKEALQSPTENKVESGYLMQGQAGTANQGSVASNATTITLNKPKIPSPDIGYNLIPNGLYYIWTMTQPQLVLDVPNGSYETGVFIQIYRYSCSAQNQWWYVTYLNNGYYSITNYQSNKCLDVPYGSAPGNKIHQSTYTGRESQQWRIAKSVSKGTIWISNRQTTLALDIPNASGASGELIQQFTPHNGLNQTWSFQRTFSDFRQCF